MEKLEQDKIQASEQAPNLAHLPLKDKLLEELRVRKTQLEQDAQSQERTNTILDLLYVCVVMCFQDLGVDMTPNLRHSHLMQTTAFEPQETHALMQMHGCARRRQRKDACSFENCCRCRCEHRFRFEAGSGGSCCLKTLALIFIGFSCAWGVDARILLYSNGTCFLLWWNELHCGLWNMRPGFESHWLHMPR